MSEKDVVRMASALLDVFAHAGKVNQLLVALASLEFGSVEAKEANICRENSSLTNMFKVFYQRFGRRYYDNVVKKVIQNLDQVGDIGLAAPQAKDAGRIGQLMFTTIDAIVSGIGFLTPPMHHMASIIRAATGLRFNSKRTTYNALSLFFFTRFVTAIFANPASFDEEFRSKTDPKVFLPKVSIPFSQLMQTPFNRLPLSKKYDTLECLNAKLVSVYLPKLYKFLMDVATVPAQPVHYDPPDQAKLTESLEFLMEITAKGYDQFAKTYREGCERPGRNPPIAWSIAIYFLKFFQENKW
jgi:hypothetical protein